MPNGDPSLDERAAFDSLGRAYPSYQPTRRCRRCFYVLNHLPENRCPECGLVFNPDDPRSYTLNLPYVRSTYWMPGLLLATAVGLLAFAILIPFTGFGWSVTLAVPMAIGAIAGYAGQVGRRAAIGVAWAAMGLCLIFMLLGGVNGIFCTLILLVIGAGPLILSVLVGVWLRYLLKNSKWSQRDWLPILLIALLPHVAGWLESQWPERDEVVVRTERTIDASPAVAWDSLRFYEEVTHDPPWVLRLGLRRPVRAIGRIDSPGDRKTCVYTRGHLVKQATDVRPGERLDFSVVEQRMFEDYSVRLTGGSFRFEPDGAGRTRVILTTRYVPLLRPRFAWQPVEEHVVHALHEHVLEGMARQSAARSSIAMELVEPRETP